MPKCDFNEVVTCGGGKGVPLRSVMSEEGVSKYRHKVRYITVKWSLKYVSRFSRHQALMG